MKNLQGCLPSAVLLLTLCGWSTAYGQMTPSADAYTNTASPTKNFGTSALLDVESASQSTYIQFDLSPLPSGYTGASIAKATLKLYVNAVTTAGSFNVDFVNGTWSENGITANLSPALGTTIVSGVPVTSANVHDYLIIDITPALVAWLDGTQSNDGIALIGDSPLNASFDSKENATMSHPPELDIVFAGGGTLTGATTAAGSGLTGGGTTGTLNLSLTNTCAANQVLQWNGSSWACAAVGTGTITGVTAGAGLLGGGTSGNVGLSLDTSKIPELAASNTFTGNQTVNGNVNANSIVTGIVGIGIQAPQFPLHVNGIIRSETGLSLGGAAPVAVDAPGVVGGRFSVLSNGTVGIGTATPRSILEAAVYAPAALGPALTLTNSGTGHTGAGSALDFNSYAPSSSGTYNPTARIAAVDANNYSNDIVFSTNQPGAANNGLQERMRITSTGGVSINGGPPMSSNPRMVFSAFLAGNLGNSQVGGIFTPDRNITMTRVSAVEQSPGSGCSTTARLLIWYTIGVVPIASILATTKVGSTPARSTCQRRAAEPIRSRFRPSLPVAAD